MNFWEELKRRNVFRVAAAYAVLAWLLIQFTEFVFPRLSLPDWTVTLVIALLIIGFPAAIFLAWAFELTPEGIKREQDVDAEASITSSTGRQLDRFIIVILLLAVTVLLVDRFWLYGKQAPEQAIERSIAVLPFGDFSADGSEAWFADGLAEEILNALTKTPDLRVASKTSSFRYRESALSVTEIGNALGVAHVLEGSVRRSPDRIRVTAQLIRSDDGFHIWSETYDRAPSEVISIQEDIAADIATALETAMDPEALREMVQVGTRSVEAYNAFLQSLALQREASSSGRFSYEDAIEALERARRIDPQFAEAGYNLAQLYRDVAQSSAMTFAEGIDADEAWDRAQSAIRQAIDVADDSPANLKYEAFQADMQMAFGLARSRLADYLEIRPNDLSGWQDYSELGRKLQDLDLVQRASEQRLRISPDDPYVMWDVGAALTLTGAVDEGASLLERALALDPRNEEIQYQAHRAFLWAGRHAEAARLEPGLLAGNVNPRFMPTVRIRAACRIGDRAAAEAAARDSNDSWGRWYVHKMLGDQATAVQVLAPLDRSPAGRDDLANFLTYPYFDPSPYPNLSAELAREGIERAPPVEIPFACPPTFSASPLPDLMPELHAPHAMAVDLSVSPDGQRLYFNGLPSHGRGR